MEVSNFQYKRVKGQRGFFALEKLENGGCILADEVGLGKTIEAGLVISQYHAQRSFNILIILPTSLAGQWNSELRKLFHISSRIDKKIHNLEVELKDMEEYLKKEEQEILEDLAELDKKINITFDREAGKKLLEQKRKRQKDLTRCRKDLLEFQNSFREMFDEEELKLMEKRFIETSTERIFSLQFRIE